MALKLEQKKEILASFQEVATRAASVVLADFRGLTAGDMTNLRQQARSQGVRLIVLRNRIAKRALKGTPYDYLTERLEGPCLCGLSLDHPGACARLFKETFKHDKVARIRALGFESKLLEPEMLGWLASMPTYEGALAILMGTLKAASAGKFAAILLALHQQKS